MLMITTKDGARWLNHPYCLEACLIVVLSILSPDEISTFSISQTCNEPHHSLLWPLLSISGQWHLFRFRFHITFCNNFLKQLFVINTLVLSSPTVVSFLHSFSFTNYIRIFQHYIITFSSLVLSLKWALNDLYYHIHEIMNTPYSVI